MSLSGEFVEMSGVVDGVGVLPLTSRSTLLSISMRPSNVLSGLPAFEELIVVSVLRLRG